MKLPRLLVKIRIALSIVILTLLTLLFLNMGGEYRAIFKILAKIQFVPALLSFTTGIFLFWLVITSLIGRVYCSSVCPMGALQDFFSWLRTRKKGTRHKYLRPSNKTRYSILGIFALFAIAGFITIPMLIDPYSAYGRIVNSFLLPLKNLIVSRSIESLAVSSLLGFFIGLVTLVLVAYFSYRKGRLICNTICPVGSTLSLISRHSVWKMEIDTDKCVGCTKCANSCKSGCIDINEHLIDTSRCVMCFNCLDACNFDALHFTASRKRLSTPLMQEIPDIAGATSASIDRRKFLAVAGIATGGAIAGTKIKAVENLAAELQGKTPITRRYAVTPPGTVTTESFHRHCTSCMLCVSNCPNKVLKASITEYGIFGIMQPTMDFDKSSCKPGCTRCTRLCPTGALQPLTKDEKLHSSIGTAQVIAENCIGCATCEAVCPYGAITMIEEKGEYIPQVDTSKCIGCGACQLNCPSTPVKAIWVEGKSS
ncbi:MAG: 4Fe-4S binding protein [Muribaculaceae bacterium]|nr:4Fe-4S binding protein [Muribaculaceae bacterium]